MMGQRGPARHVSAAMDRGVRRAEFPPADEGGVRRESDGARWGSTKLTKHTARRPTIFTRSATDKPVFFPPKSSKRRDIADQKRSPEIQKREGIRRFN